MQAKSLRWIFLTGLFLRTLPVIFTYSLGIGLDDMFQYDMLARSILAGNGYRWYAEPDLHLAEQYIDLNVDLKNYDPRGILTSHRAPLYPLFLAGVYGVFGLEKRFFFARLIQAILGAFLGPLTFFITRRVFPGEVKTAKLAGWAVALYPMLLLYPLALVTEDLFFVLVLGLVWASLWAVEKKSGWAFILPGLALGLSALTRSIIFFTLPLILFWIWRSGKNRKGALIFAITAILVVTPWSVRNSLLHHRLMFIESSLGYNLYLGYHPKSTGTFQYGISLDLLPITDDAERNYTGTRMAMEFIRQDPLKVPYLMIRKAGYFWGLERRALEVFYSAGFFGKISTPFLLILMGVFYFPLVILLSLAVFSIKPKPFPAEMWLLYAIVLGYFLPHILILSEERFHMALVPLVAVMAAHTWVNRKEIFRRENLHPTKNLILLASLVLLVLFWGNWIAEIVRDWARLAVILGPNGFQTPLPY